MTDTTGMMPLERAKELKTGERVRVMVSGRGDVDGEGELEFPAGEVLTVDMVDTFPAPQGWAVTCTAPNGVTNVFDEADFGGLYPFSEVLPPLSEFLPPLDHLCSKPAGLGYIFAEEERDTILAALRFWQERGGEASADILDIATNGDAHPLMTGGEIDSLCERINS